VRRLQPRPLSQALEGVVGGLAPPSLLARIQAVWDQAVGEQVAAVAQPVAESQGVVTVSCSSSTWANELNLLGAEVVSRLNRAIGAADNDAGAIQQLRMVVRSSSLGS
jgi:predicted nucleic acid-binding Zn ribbon protein